MSDTKNIPASSEAPVQESFHWWRVVVPVAIGAIVVALLFHHEFKPEVWKSVHFDVRTILCIALAWLFMAGRDFGLTWRFRSLTDRQLSWKAALRVNFMCEFTSAITPSAVGGSSLGMVFMHREGIDLGRATTLMLTTLLLDEFFFVVACPVVMALAPTGELFGFGDSAFDRGLRWVFWLVYAGICIWTFLLFMGILVKPEGIRNALLRLFNLKFLRRWRSAVEELGDNMTATSRSVRTRPVKWWLEAFGATALTWSSRFLVVNALFLAFAAGANQLVVFGRQFVVWVVLMVSPTPGGSGVSEWLFTEYYGDMLANASVALVIALFWRIITYYVYIFIGVCLVPSFFGKRSRKIKNPDK